MTKPVDLKKIKNIGDKVYDELDRAGYTVFADRLGNGFEISRRFEKNLDKAKDICNTYGVPCKVKKFRDRFYLTVEIPEENVLENKKGLDKVELKEAQENLHVFTQVDDDRWQNYVVMEGGEIYFDPIEKGGDGIVITGNDNYRSFGDQKLIDIIHNDYYDDELGYDYDTMEELKRVTGKSYDSRDLKGYSQGEWNEIFYPTGTSNELLNAIENEYMGKYDIYDDGEDWVIVYHDDAWKGAQRIKEIISEQTGYPIETIKIKKFDGYKKVPNYVEESVSKELADTFAYNYGISKSEARRRLSHLSKEEKENKLKALKGTIKQNAKAEIETESLGQLKEDFETEIDWKGGIQEISRRDYYHFLDCMPPVEPKNPTEGYTGQFLMGEPYSSDEQGRLLFSKFGKKDGKYYFLGNDYAKRGSYLESADRKKKQGYFVKYNIGNTQKEADVFNKNMGSEKSESAETESGATSAETGAMGEQLIKEKDPKARERINQEIDSLEKEIDYADDHNNPSKVIDLQGKLSKLQEHKDKRLKSSYITESALLEEIIEKVDVSALTPSQISQALTILTNKNVSMEALPDYLYQLNISSKLKMPWEDIMAQLGESINADELAAYIYHNSGEKEYADLYKDEVQVVRVEDVENKVHSSKDLREAFNRLDQKEYRDLVNMYDSVILNKKQQANLVEMFNHSGEKTAIKYLEQEYNKQVNID